HSKAFEPELCSDVLSVAPVRSYQPRPVSPLSSNPSWKNVEDCPRNGPPPKSTTATKVAATPAAKRNFIAPRPDELAVLTLGNRVSVAQETCHGLHIRCSGFPETSYRVRV